MPTGYKIPPEKKGYVLISANGVLNIVLRVSFGAYNHTQTKEKQQNKKKNEKLLGRLPIYDDIDGVCLFDMFGPPQSRSSSANNPSIHNTPSGHHYGKLSGLIFSYSILSCIE